MLKLLLSLFRSDNYVWCVEFFDFNHQPQQILYYLGDQGTVLSWARDILNYHSFRMTPTSIKPIDPQHLNNAFPLYGKAIESEPSPEDLRILHSMSTRALTLGGFFGGAPDLVYNPWA